MHEFVDTILSLDADSGVRSIIVTGRGKAFAAGADIKEMATLTQQDVSGG
jgi:enoyl-CoA hydratase